MELIQLPLHELMAFHIPFPIYFEVSQLDNQGVANELYLSNPALRNQSNFLLNHKKSKDNLNSPTYIHVDQTNIIRRPTAPSTFQNQNGINVA